ncbi:type I-C CRISPR-associated protein Cas5, partial [Bacillus mycoides]
DNYGGDIHLGTMVHGLNYPDETGRNQLEVRLWNPVIRDGIIQFIRPEECSQIRKISRMEPKVFDRSNVESVDELIEQLEVGGE